MNLKRYLVPSNNSGWANKNAETKWCVSRRSASRFLSTPTDTIICSSSISPAVPCSTSSIHLYFLSAFSSYSPVLPPVGIHLYHLAVFRLSVEDAFHNINIRGVNITYLRYTCYPAMTLRSFILYSNFRVIYTLQQYTFTANFRHLMGAGDTR